MATETAIGRWVRRDDGEPKITGRARYAGDVRLPDMLHARLVLSAHAHARITGIEVEEARQVPGVVGVFCADDLPLVVPEDLTRTRDPLARNRTYFEGQPVVAVVAETEEIAEDAVSLVQVHYEELEVAVDPISTLGDERELVHDAATLGIRDDAGAHTNVGGHTEQLPRPANAAEAQRYRRGDVERGLAEADLVVEQEYRTPWLHQSYMEPQSSVAVPDGAGGLTVYTSTQGQFFVRSEVAAALGIPLHRIKVVAMEVGGGFGAKYALLDPLVAGLAWATGRPVRLVFTRNEDFLASNPAPGTVVRVKTGAKRDGSLTALQATVVVDTGAYPGATAGILSILLGGTYRWPNLMIDAYEVLTNKPGAGAYRAPGAPQACFAIESQMDEMARQLGLDPLEFRLKNAIQEGDPLPDGEPLPRVGSVEVLKRLRDHPTWQRRNEKEEGEGVAMAFGSWPGGTQPASAACRLNSDGSLTIVVGSVDISGTATGFGLIAAQELGVGVDGVQVMSADTDTAPFAGASGGSKITYTVGAAVAKAAADARQQILDVAADFLEAAPEDLTITGDQVQVRGVPDRGVSLARIAQLSTGFGAKYQPVLGQGRVAQPTAAPGFIAHLARVKLDRETGTVTVREYVAVQDVGRAINPAGVVGQVQGGVTQGIGWALYERLVYDDQGRLRTATFADYDLPSAPEIPAIDSVLVEVESPQGPYGARGVGEPPIVGGPAAIANAIRDAIGIRLTEVPMTAERVLTALSGRDVTSAQRA